MQSLSDFDIPTLADQLAAWDHPRTHARKILRDWYDHGAILTLPKGAIGHRLHARITQELLPTHTQILRRQHSTDGTLKLLIALPPNHGQVIESVLMPGHRPDRAAGCLSSQVGCAMACDFCASTKSGLQRDLTAGEIVEQFLHLRREAHNLGRRLQTIVFMGMGEPLLNYENLITAIQRIADPSLGAIGWRQVTVSTVGIIPGIERLMHDNLGVQLAVSLHAPDDDTRAAIVPTARKYKVRDIINAAHAYQQHTGRVTNIEYTLLAGVNDAESQARHLAHLLQDKRMHVNLIPYNPIGPGLSGRTYERPTTESMHRFAQILRDRAVVTHFRQTRGDDIDGACGQLRDRTTTLNVLS